MIAAKASYFTRTALGGMWRDPFVHVIAIASLAIALIGFGLARIAGAQIDGLVAALGGEVELTVYLKDGTPPDDVAKLEAALTQRTGGKAKAVSPAEALARLSEQLGPQGAALTELGANPLPWSVEVVLPPAQRDPQTLKALADTVRGLPFVEAVDYGADALERLGALSKGLKLASVIAFADGHVERHRWTEARTRKTVGPTESILHTDPAPDSPDLAWLRARTTTRK